MKGMGVRGSDPGPAERAGDEVGVVRRQPGASGRPPGAGRSARVRPYAITGGRTRFGHVLLVETLVSALNRPADPSSRALPELEEICRLCRGHMRSIAEISALLRMPLGVVRVLVSDLADQGRIRVHGAHSSGTGSAVDADGEPVLLGGTNRALLERVLGGLRKL